jgi:hypothetical protein
MKKIIICLCFVSCQAGAEQEQTDQVNQYSYSDYQVDLLEYQTAYDSQEIKTTGDQATGYTVQGYLLNHLVYDKWSDMATDTTAMIEQADQAINELIPSPNENH